MGAYFERRANRRARAAFAGYGCSRRDLQEAEQIRCVSGARLVTAKSFGY
jgi:hypothetical protein